MEAPTQVNLDAGDIFNHIKAFAVHEMAKAQAIMHSAYGECKDDTAKIAAQGAHTVLKDLFEILTGTIKKAVDGTFDFKSETSKILENINAIDPYMMARIQLLAPNPAVAEANTAAPVEGTAQ